MRPTVVMVLVFISALTVLMVTWIAPAVRLHNSACDRYPYTSGCR
jgi:hypothetical protein